MTQQTIYKQLQLLAQAIRIAEDYDVVPTKEECEESGEEYDSTLSEYEGEAYADLVSELLTYIEEITE